MKRVLISHRGNVTGPDPKNENKIEYINKALKLGYDVEIDVWYVKGEFYLGHDRPDYLVDDQYLKQKKLWCHAKNYEALYQMMKKGIHCFWHETDKVTITSKGYVWAYPGQQPLKNSIAVMPEINNEDTSASAGVCSDYIEKYKEN